MEVGRQVAPDCYTGTVCRILIHLGLSWIPMLRRALWCWFCRIQPDHNLELIRIIYCDSIDVLTTNNKTLLWMKRVERVGWGRVVQKLICYAGCVLWGTCLDSSALDQCDQSCM